MALAEEADEFFIRITKARTFELASDELDRRPSVSVSLKNDRLPKMLKDKTSVSKVNRQVK